MKPPTVSRSRVLGGEDHDEAGAELVGDRFERKQTAKGDQPHELRDGLIIPIASGSDLFVHTSATLEMKSQRLR